MYKVYIKLDTNNCIIGVESSAFYTEDELLDKGYILVDQGKNGEVYGHAQPNYLKIKFGKPTYDEMFHPNFKYVNNEIVELTDGEKEMLLPAPETQPTDIDKLDARLTYLEIMSEVNV